MELGKAKKMLEREKFVVRVEYLRKAKILKIFAKEDCLSKAYLNKLFPDARSISVETDKFLDINTYTYIIRLRK